MKPKRETLRHREAFEVYWTLGEKRSLKAVATHFKVSETAVANWSTSFGWSTRLAERDSKVADIVAEKNISEVAETKKRILQLCRAVMGRFAQELTKGTVKPSVADFVRVGQLELLLQGMATSREEHYVNGKPAEGRRELLAWVIQTAEDEKNNSPWLDVLRTELRVLEQPRGPRPS